MLSLIFVVGCDYLVFFPQTTTSVISTVPTKVNGTITFEDSNYPNLPEYESETYSLKNIHEYNEILLSTKSLIRHANIQIIATLYESRFPFPWSSEPEEYLIGSSSGSGFIFLEDEEFYYALTNYHVISNDGYIAKYEIKTFGETEYRLAELVAFSEEYDLAVIKFTKENSENIEVLDIYPRLYYRFNIGEIVLAVGNPGSLTNNVTFGAFQSMQSLDDVSFKVIYHDASIARGSSGGALVDIDGNLIGVNTWGLQNSDEFSFAIPNYIVYTFLINSGVLE